MVLKSKKTSRKVESQSPPAADDDDAAAGREDLHRAGGDDDQTKCAPFSRINRPFRNHLIRQMCVVYDMIALRWLLAAWFGTSGLVCFWYYN